MSQTPIDEQPSELSQDEVHARFCQAMAQYKIANPDKDFNTLFEFILNDSRFLHLRGRLATMTEDYYTWLVGEHSDAHESDDGIRRSERIRARQVGNVTPANTEKAFRVGDTPLAFGHGTGRTAGTGDTRGPPSATGGRVSGTGGTVRRGSGAGASTSLGARPLSTGQGPPSQCRGTSPPYIGMDIQMRSLDIGAEEPFGTPAFAGDGSPASGLPARPMASVPMVAASGVDVTPGGQRLTIGVNESGTKMNVSLPAKFNPLKHQWSVWSLQVQRVLTVMKVVDILDPAKRAIFEDSTRQMIISLLHEVMSDTDSNMFVTMRCQYPDEIWTALQRKYKSKDDFRKNELHRKFHSMRQFQDETVSAWVVRLSTVKTELQSLSGRNSVPDISHKIALVDRTLPSLTPGQTQVEHSTFFAELRQQMETLTITAIEDRLIQRADAFREQLEVARGHAGRDAPLNALKPGIGYGRGRSGNPAAAAAAPADANSICHRCLLPGHKSPNCPGKDLPLALKIKNDQYELRDVVRGMIKSPNPRGSSNKRVFPKDVSFNLNHA